MHRIDQRHSVPLLDIICYMVFKMNQSGRPVFLNTLLDEICKEYPQIELPKRRVFRQAIQTLMKKKLLAYDLEQLYICFPPTAPYHSNKIPPKCTVECQTGQSVMDDNAPSNLPKVKRGFLARLFMKKDNPPKETNLGRNPSNPSNQSKPPLTSTFSAQSDNVDEKSSAAQKTHLPHENEFYRNWIKTSNQYLPNKFNPMEYFSWLTSCKSIKNKISRKERSKKEASKCGETSTSAQRGSDSVFSLSPVITEISHNIHNSRSGDISLEERTVVSQSHTYVNVMSNESTQFEDITQVEKTPPTTLSITNV
uniref:Stork_head domain-containing protein n=1 Tax=Elaeophora elaphi TaxID=1147741 RepID=A0A0R3S4R5_9BILA